jgi:DNA-binding NarL/FixJ family response regulator
MTDIVIADQQELFRLGLGEILSVANGFRIVGQAESSEQVLSTLKLTNPHVLILSTSFLSVFPKIQRILKRCKTALLVLAEDNDEADYMQWLRAHGVVHRSTDSPVLLDAIRRVTQGELRNKDRNSVMGSNVA